MYDLCEDCFKESSVKSFAIGDQVKVTSGKYEGKKGQVLSTTEKRMRSACFSSEHHEPIACRTYSRSSRDITFTLRVKLEDGNDVSLAPASAEDDAREESNGHTPTTTSGETSELPLPVKFVLVAIFVVALGSFTKFAWGLLPSQEVDFLNIPPQLEVLTEQRSAGRHYAAAELKCHFCFRHLLCCAFFFVFVSRRMRKSCQSSYKTTLRITSTQ